MAAKRRRTVELHDFEYGMLSGEAFAFALLAEAFSSEFDSTTLNFESCFQSKQ